MDGVEDLAVTSGIEFVVMSVAAPVGHEVVVVTIDGVSVAVADLGAGLVAFDETCTHRECPLSEGSFLDATVTCPCHKSRFDLRTGQPINGPATEPIRIRAVRVEGGNLAIER